MRNITKIKRKRISERISFDHFLQLWFNYHFLFFHSLIFRGLKLKAFNFFCKIKKELKIFERFDPAFIFLVALLKITPSLMLKPLQVSGVTYDAPFPITYWKKISFGCKWVIKLVKDNYGLTIKTIVESLTLSLIDEGISMNKKDIVYEIASLNRHLIRNKIFKK